MKTLSGYKALWTPGEGCVWEADQPVWSLLRMNAHYLAPPERSEHWEQWLVQARQYRRWVREHLHDARYWYIRLQYDGVRAWVRLGREEGFLLHLQPGETIVVTGEARRLSGSAPLLLAFDWCDRAQGASGAWLGWSSAVARTDIPTDGRRHTFRLEAKVPSFDASRAWARPIVGQDATVDTTPGGMLLRGLCIHYAPGRERDRRMSTLRRHLAFDDSLYTRRDLLWTQKCFVCGFLFVYDRAFWDASCNRYRVAELIEEALQEFGGYDAVVLWHAYPRIGADERNQFDFWRDMPGGLPGVRAVIEQFHQHNVRVFLPYMPWDVGTRREGRPDVEVLAEVVAQLRADGIFLDTMVEAPPQLSQHLDRCCKGVALEPEVHPAIHEMEQCNASWAQWLQAWEDIGILHLKWIEPRHMQHQIRRWDTVHTQELAGAWLNGSGILVWENVFGSWNPWRWQDRSALRRMAPVWRTFADLFAQGEWLPCYPTHTPDLLASCWRGDDRWLWTLYRQRGDPPVALPVPPPLCGEDWRWYDLWRGEPLRPVHQGGEWLVKLLIERFGALLALRGRGSDAKLRRLLEHQHRLEDKPPVRDGHVRALSVVEGHMPPRRPHPASIPPSALPVAGGTFTFIVRHQRRECGCYPDAGTPRDEWAHFLIGNPFHEQIEHRVTRQMRAFRIMPAPVTNAQFQAFLDATGYTPSEPTNFLKHWGGRRCSPALQQEPVVYVDINDARAYAEWAGGRLPDEWEWQNAVQQVGDQMQWGLVWEWTEGVRDDGHTRFVILRGGSRYQAQGSIWYFPGGRQPANNHAKFILLYPGLDRCSTIGFRCVWDVETG